MTTQDRSSKLTGIATDIGLTVVFALTLTITAMMLVNSWGGNYWMFNCAAGAVVCLLALARRFHRAWTAIAALGVAAVAMVVSESGDLPQEPGPAMGMALAVLVGSAIRALPVAWAAGIAAGALAIVVACWATGGFTTLSIVSSLAWLAALGIGLALRTSDARRRAAAAGPTYDPGLEYLRQDGTRAR